MIVVTLVGRKAHSAPVELDFSLGCAGWLLQGAPGALQIWTDTDRFVSAWISTDHASAVKRRMRPTGETEIAEAGTASLSVSELSLRRNQSGLRLCIERPCNFITVCNCYAGIVRLSVTPEAAFAAGKTRFFGGPFVCSALFMGCLATEASDCTTLFERH